MNRNKPHVLAGGIKNEQIIERRFCKTEKK